MLDMIVAGSNVLPLRPIHLVKMGLDEDAHRKILIFVEKPLYRGLLKIRGEPDYAASVRKGDFKETFLRLQNTCIKKFRVGIRGNPFLRYWTAREAANFTVVKIAFTVVSIYTRLEDGADYAVLDSIVNHLRPRTTKVEIDEFSWLVGSYNNENVQILARDSYLNHVQTCRLYILDDAFPPPSFILSEPGYRNYELDCVYRCEGCEAADKIDGFIESFVRDGWTNGKLKTVCIQWYDSERQQQPALKQLKKPTKIDEPLPKNDLTALLTREFHQVTQCEMHVFVNKKQWKRMEVCKWTVKYDEEEDRHTAHVLQCRVENL